jgi:hypothetical protein
MRYLRMLSNSLVAGSMAAACLVVLFLQLNPAMPLYQGASWGLIATIWAGYGVNFSALFYALIVAQQLLAAEVLSPGWFSVRLLAPFCASATVLVAALMWLNLRGLHAALDDEGVRRMTIGAAAMTACGLAFVLVTILRYSIGPRSGRAGGITVLAVMLVSITLPVAIRGPGVAPTLGGRRLAIGAPATGELPSARVVLIDIDGASLDFITPAAADGRLPNFERILDAGAALHLATLKPTQPAPVLTALATGKLPAHNGVRSAAIYSATAGPGATLDLLPDYCFAHGLVTVGLLSETPQTSAALRAQPIWSILSQSGTPSTVIRWPLTWPAQPLLGALVTDQYHRASDLALAADEPGYTYPTELALDLDPSVLDEPATAASALPGPDYPAAGPLALDRLYVAIANRLESRGSSPLLALRLEGLDATGHYYLRQAMPRAFGDVSDEERRKYGQVLEQYYRYVDAVIGGVIDGLGPRDLLLVVSPFGLEPLSPAKRLLEHSIGNTALSGSHERAPDGFLLAYGRPVKPGRLPRGAIVDVTPTILYFLGLPVGRDMDGFARADIFTREFTASRPIAYIPTYER